MEKILAYLKFGLVAALSLFVLVIAKDTTTKKVFILALSFSIFFFLIIFLAPQNDFSFKRKLLPEHEFEAKDNAFQKLE